MGFPTKNDHFGGCLGGYHYLRKHPYSTLYHRRIEMAWAVIRQVMRAVFLRQNSEVVGHRPRDHP